MTQNSNTPSYIKALLAPNKSRGSRRAWSIDVESVWVPFFTATNVMGETDLPDDVLGAPIRLARSKDGEIRFNDSGRPITRVHPDLNAQVTLVRENFVAGLQAYTGSVQEERPDAYGEHVARQYAAGQPIEGQELHEVAQAVAKLKAEVEETDAQGDADSQTEEVAPNARGRRNTPKPEPELATTNAS